MRQKYYKQKQTANADSVNNLMRQWNTSYLISMPSTGKRTIYKKTSYSVCAELHFNICKETGVKLDNKHGYDHVPKSVKMSHEGKVTTLWEKTSAK